MANVYKVVLYMAWLGVGGHPWNYSFEMAWGPATIDDGATNEDDLTPDDFVMTEGAVTQIAAAFQPLHLPQVYFDRITVSTWRPDTRDSTGDAEDYDATEAIPYPLGFFGTRSGVGGSPRAGLDDTLFIRRKVGSGNQGRMNLRGVLVQDDFDANAQGIKTLKPLSEVQTGSTLQDNLNDALAVYLNESEGTEALRFVLAGVPKGGTVADLNIRNVEKFIFSGYKNKQLKNQRQTTGAERAISLLVRQGYAVPVKAGGGSGPGMP